MLSALTSVQVVQHCPFILGSAQSTSDQLFLGRPIRGVLIVDGRCLGFVAPTSQKRCKINRYSPDMCGQGKTGTTRPSTVFSQSTYDTHTKHHYFHLLQPSPHQQHRRQFSFRQFVSVGSSVLVYLHTNDPYIMVESDSLQ